MLTWLLIIIFTFLITWVILALVVNIGGTGEPEKPMPKSSEVIKGNEQAIDAGDIDSLQFHVEMRGYNQQEVDQTIEYLMQRLAAATDTTVRTAADRDAHSPLAPEAAAAQSYVAVGAGSSAEATLPGSAVSEASAPVDQTPAPHPQAAELHAAPAAFPTAPQDTVGQDAANQDAAGQAPQPQFQWPEAATESRNVAQDADPSKSRLDWVQGFFDKKK